MTKNKVPLEVDPIVRNKIREISKKNGKKMYSIANDILKEKLGISESEENEQ